MQMTLKSARYYADMTLREVAEKTGRDKNTISNWEKEKTPITKRDFDMLCELYGVDPGSVKVK